MYVIKSNTGTGDRFFPADRCTFNTVADTNGGYVIHVGADNTDAARALFYDGVNSSPTEIPGNLSASSRPTLGYIGKSGRFVEITNS